VREIFAYNTHIAGTDLFFIVLNPYPECKTNLWIQIKIRRVPHADNKNLICKKYRKSGRNLYDFVVCNHFLSVKMVFLWKKKKCKK
jgi:hypothetical protein